MNRFFLCSALFLLCFTWLSSAQEADAPQKSIFDTMAAVKWKPDMLKRDTPGSKTPCLGGLEPPVALSIVDKEVDYAALILEPKTKLMRKRTLNLSETETLAYKSRQYEELSEFLVNAENYAIRWFIAERVNSVQEYIEDVSILINLCKEKGVDDQLAGIWIDEHDKNNPVDLCKTVLAITTQINTKTDRWLKRKAVITNGGRYGMYFKFYDNAPVRKQSSNKNLIDKGLRIQDGEYLASIYGGIEQTDFFREMAKQCEQHAFGVKIIDMNRRFGPETDSASAWNTYFIEHLGLSELKRAFDNLPGDSMHKNAVFVGGVDDGFNANLVLRKHHNAFNGLRKAMHDYGWKGIIAGIPFGKGGLFEKQTDKVATTQSHEYWTNWRNNLSLE